MAGIDRNAANSMRLRRNMQRGRAGAFTSGIKVAAPLSNTGSQVQLNLDSAGGLESSSSLLRVKLIDTSLSRTASGLGVALRTNAGLNISSGVGILLPASSGLQTLAGGLSVLLPANSGLQTAAGGLSILLNATPGLEISTGLRIKQPANSGLTVDSTGLFLALATTTVKGGVLKAALIADQAVLTDNSGGTSGAGTIAAIGIAVTDPADTPVDADALRDDLVANTIPSIETELSNLRNAVATLAAYNNTVKDKINAILLGQKNAGQMSTV